MPKTLMQSVKAELEKERHRLQDELRRVTAALTAFGKVYMKGGRTKGGSRKRTISAAGRRRIAAAQRVRWAKFKAARAKRGKK